MSKQGDYWLIKTDFQKAAAAAHLATLPVSLEKPYSIKIEPYRHIRHLAQSRLFHMWCSEASKQGHEYTPEQVKSIAKLRWGVPILLAENEGFAAYWARVSPIFPIYEERWEMLMPRTPVTSEMTVKQMSQFLGDFQRVQGSKYKLTDPALMGLE